MGRAEPRPVGEPSRVWRSVVVGVLLAGTAGVLVALALRPPADAPEPTGTPVDDRVSTWTPAGPPVPPSPSPSSSPAAPEPVALPEHLTIPSIAVSTDLLRLGLRADRTVEVPQDAALAGWFEEGPVPGQPGSSVVLGHVDSVDGPAVFYRLSQLRPGDLLQVRLTDGSVARFEVRRVATYANADFPADEVYAGDPDRHALNLVTCGGWYDAAQGGWQGNVVVFTELVAGT